MPWVEKNRKINNRGGGGVGVGVGDDYSGFEISPTQTCSSLCHSPHRCFLFSAAAYTGQPSHTDVFFPLTQPKKANLSTQTFFSSAGAKKANLSTRTFSQPTEAYLTTQTLSFHCHSPHWLTRPSRPSIPFLAVDE